MENKILPLSRQTITLLEQKHLQTAEVVNYGLLPDETEIIQFKKYKSVNAELVRNAILKITGRSEPSGVDADGWRRIILSTSFWERPIDLCKTIVNLLKNNLSRKDFAQ